MIGTRGVQRRDPQLFSEVLDCLHGSLCLSISSRIARATRDVLELELLANLVNSLELNCGPLSLLTISGIPCLANRDLRVFMMVLDVVDRSCIISG